MNEVWWTLPGPAAFVEGIQRDIRDGKNVIVCLPEYAPPGLRGAVGATLGDIDNHVQSLEVDDFRKDPLAALARRFGCGNASHQIVSIPGLLDDEEFVGRILWLDGLDEQSWIEWVRFVQEYQHACRALPVFDRTVFCWVLRGGVACDPLAADVCLAVHNWKGVVSGLDMLLYSSVVVSETVKSGVERHLAAAILSEVAVSDPAVVDLLAYRSLGEIVAPQDLLANMAEERGWAERASSPEWCEGAVDWRDGSRAVHSAALFAEGSPRALEQRVWRGQVGVLLPYVEVERQRLLPDLRAHLKGPFEMLNGEALELEDLEVGQILYQIDSRRVRVPGRLYRRLRGLRTVRNRLSHSEAVPWGEVAALT